MSEMDRRGSGRKAHCKRSTGLRLAVRHESYGNLSSFLLLSLHIAGREWARVHLTPAFGFPLSARGEGERGGKVRRAVILSRRL